MEFLFLFIVIGAVIFLSFKTDQRRLKPQEYIFHLQFKVTKDEFYEANKLKEHSYFSNDFIKNETIVLYLIVKRLLVKEKSWMEKSEYREPVLQACKFAVAGIYDYPPFDHIAEEHNEAVKKLNDPDLWQFIERQARIHVYQFTGQDDRAFYYRNGDAWKIRYSHLINNYDTENTEQFYTGVCQLATMNDKRVTVERDIYFQAHQFLIQKDKSYALRFYLHYLNVKTMSETFKYKKISKRNNAILFKNSKEEGQFKLICTRLLQNKNLKAALKQLDQLGISQRKKIDLDISAIKEAAGKQTKIAGILSEVLADDEPATIPQAPEKTPVIEIQNTPVDNKEELFRLFINCSYKLNKEEVDIFARTKGIFRSQFIESINETYYDELDDVLIEEDDDEYILNETYFHQIKG